MIEAHDIIKETDKYIEFRRNGSSYTNKEQKFPTVGGPFDGQTLSRTQVGRDYLQFNRDAAIKVIPKQVNIHNSLLAISPESYYK